MLTRIDEAWEWFEEFQTNNPHSCLPIETYLSLSSIRFGFEAICNDFSQYYQDVYDPETNNVYLCPYRLTTNDVELFFSKQRGRHCDGDVDI